LIVNKRLFQNRTFLSVSVRVHAEHHLFEQIGKSAKRSFNTLSALWIYFQFTSTSKNPQLMIEEELP